MTPSVEGLEAELVYIAVNEIAAADMNSVAGKVVLTDGLAMEPIVRSLQEKGALGAAFITGQFVHNMIVSRVWGSPTPDTIDDYVKIPVVSFSYDDGLAVKLLIKAQDSRCRLTTRTHARWVEIPVLTAEIGNCSEEFVMVTGHNDSWHMGAMDNASGNACAVELARILSSKQNQMKRGVRFVTWSGHSHGRYAGSTAYCDRHFVELHEKCVLNVNTDCLGGCGATLLTQSPAMACTDDLARRVLKQAAGVSDWEGTRFSRSCDQSFWGAGVPSIFSQVSEQPPVNSTSAAAFQAMFGGAKSGGYGFWWHSSEDTIDKLDVSNLERDTKIFLATLEEVLFAEALPLNPEAEARELLTCTRTWQEKAGASLDLSEVLEAMDKLILDIHSLESQAQQGSIRMEKRNRTVHALLRELIALRYVKGSIYSHDAALRQSDVPMLSIIDEILSAQDEHHKNAAKIAARRTCNRMMMALRRAQMLLEAAKA